MGLYLSKLVWAYLRVKYIIIVNCKKSADGEKKYFWKLPKKTEVTSRSGKENNREAVKSKNTDRNMHSSLDKQNGRRREEGREKEERRNTSLPWNMMALSNHNPQRDMLRQVSMWGRGSAQEQWGDESSVHTTLCSDKQKLIEAVKGKNKHSFGAQRWCSGKDNV